ncbi:MAG: DNA recombination/repair protein RecA, partial [Planctomycetes bacterium]|nr:DNA recombination/repair protein RecA [Planctomycetota bacterium]
MAKTKKITKKTKTKVTVEALAPKTTKVDSALERTIAQIEKQYGSGAIMKMDDSVRTQIDGIQTGALSLDLALG